MYEKAIVTFLDVLGFSSLVETRPAEEVSMVLEQVEKFSAAGGESDEPYPATVLAFSDSVVRIRHLESEANRKFRVGLFFHELMDLLHAQCELVYQGILIRGGMTVGQVVSGTRVFGPALTEAYNLGSGVLHYPRISVGPAALHGFYEDPLMRSQHNPFEYERNTIRKLLRRDADGIWYIDYLRAFAGELDDPDLYLKFLRRHRQLIESGNTESEPLSSVGLKYTWLAFYHNKQVRKIDKWLASIGANRDSLEVSTDLVKSTYNF